MITSTIPQLHGYRIFGPHFAKAIDYALSTDFAPMEPGKYDIDGVNALAIVNEYMTKPSSACDLESHREYADIQIMIAGEEKFGYIPLTDQEPSIPFRADNDVAFYSLPERTRGGEGSLNYITLYPGQFIIFFPSDIHQPELFTRQPTLVKKVVIKVKVGAHLDHMADNDTSGKNTI
jgi:YhcH/YjgK/YiaL family protein